MFFGLVQTSTFSITDLARANASVQQAIRRFSFLQCVHKSPPLHPVSLFTARSWSLLYWRNFIFVFLLFCLHNLFIFTSFFKNCTSLRIPYSRADVFSQIARTAGVAFSAANVSRAVLTPDSRISLDCPPFSLPSSLFRYYRKLSYFSFGLSAPEFHSILPFFTIPNNNEAYGGSLWPHSSCPIPQLPGALDAAGRRFRAFLSPCFTPLLQLAVSNS